MSVISFTLEQFHNFSVFHDTGIFEESEMVVLQMPHVDLSEVPSFKRGHE